jgi:porphobilinogen deaminase
VRVERGVLAAFEGGCHAAVGAWLAPDGTLHAGADEGSGWRSVALRGSVTDAVAAIRSASGEAPTAWARPASPWERWG